MYDSRNNCNAIIETASNTLIAGCKNTIIPNSVTSIGESAFYKCYGLTSIEIPSSVTIIGGEAFYNCDGLTSIEIPNSVTGIEITAFAYCDNLTSVEIPNSVTSIGEYAFLSCTGLTSIEIPNSVTSIKYGAFYFCTGLTSITSHIPADKLFVPGTNAFYNVDKTNCTLYVPKGAKATYAATNGWSDFTNIVEAYTLTVSSAGYATMFLDYAVEIPEGVEVYTANRVEGDRLKMQLVEEIIPANTGVIVRAEQGTYSFAKSDETPAAISGNLLTGTVADTYIKPSGVQVAYVLSQVDGVVGMYPAKLKDDGTFKNNANKVYMLLSDISTGEGNLDTSDPGSQLSAGYRFDFSGTTGVEGVEIEGNTRTVYYDLSGRRVENPTHGIYIVGGKKVIVK